MLDQENEEQKGKKGWNRLNLMWKFEGGKLSIADL